MKHLSLVKIIVALCICNVYVFTCGVMGAVGENTPPQSADEKVSDTESGVDNDIIGQGTQDFLGSDNTINTAAPSSSDKSERIDTLSFEKPALVQKPVSSSFIPSPLTKSYPEPSQSSSEESVQSSSSSTESSVVLGVPHDEPERNDSSTVSSTTEPPESSETTSSEYSEPEQTSSESSESSEETESSSSEIPTQPSEIVTNNSAANEILTVNNYGEVVSGTALDIVSRITACEIGGTFAPEAIKAQAVASYSYVKFFNDRGNTPSVLLSDEVSDSVRVLVASVIGEAVYCDGEIIQAVYSASSAGYTASSENVWGTYLPYLQSVYCELDEDYDPNYGRTVTFSSDEMKSRVYNTTGISLSGDPADWFEIEDYTEGKYVGDMNIAGYHTYVDSDGDTITINGRVFRERIMSFDVRSGAFDIDYDEDSDEFTITTYGYGHGVGMSQNGANNLAKYWDWNYKQILEFYYTDSYVQ